MVCEYFSIRNGEPFCKAYGKLEQSNQEKISECESNFFDCFERTGQTLMKKVEGKTYRGLK